MSHLTSRRQLLKSCAACVIASIPPSVAAQVGHAGAKLPASGAGAAPSPSVGPTPILVLNSLDADVSVIDPITHTQRQRVPTGKEPHHLYLTPDEKSVIVANAASDSLTFIDPVSAQVQRMVRQIIDPYHLRFSPDMKWFVTAANRLDHIDIYRWQAQNFDAPLALAKRVYAAKTPSHLMIDSQSRVVYVTLQDSDQLVALDLATQSVRYTVPIGRMPADLYLTADDRTLLIGMTGADVVEAYDVTGAAPKLIKRITTGKGAHAFRAWGDRRHVFVSNRVANTISVIDTQALAVVEQYAAPGGPDCMEFLSDQRTLLVTSRWARKLTYIDTEDKRIMRQVPVGRSPHGVWTLAHAGRV
jgi:YVTN family beta-propeller protein